MSLDKEQVKTIYDLIREIMYIEGVGYIPVVIKPGVWSTTYSHDVAKVSPLKSTIYNPKIQLGGVMLTGTSFPRRIYYISIYDSNYRIYSIKNPRKIMLAAIVASTILEEVAHAIAYKVHHREVKPHGVEFLSAFKDLWIKHFIMLLFKLQGVYGISGDSGEDYL